jgi:hypothetical protein
MLIIYIITDSYIYIESTGIPFALSGGQKRHRKEAALTTMLKKTLSMFLISGLIIAMLVSAVVGTTVSQADKKTRILTGTIIEKDLYSLTIGVNNRPGEIVTLTAGPAIDLTAFLEGDQIRVAHDQDRAIQSIVKTG